MTIAFYEHPFSSYVQKAKTALYEKGIPFESKMIDCSEPVASEFAALWPALRGRWSRALRRKCTSASLEGQFGERPRGRLREAPHDRRRPRARRHCRPRWRRPRRKSFQDQRLSRLAISTARIWRRPPIDADGDQHGLAPDDAALAHLLITRVEDDVRKGLAEGALGKGPEALVQALVDGGDGGGREGMAAQFW